jgi:hypothetical protein
MRRDLLIRGDPLFGSEGEFVKSGILCGFRDFVKSDVFGVDEGHALRLE